MLGCPHTCSCPTILRIFCSLVLPSFVGSTTVYPYDDPNLEPIELGASVFVEANKNLWRASDEFGFERQDFEEGEDTMGIWDGEQFLITVCSL